MFLGVPPILIHIALTLALIESLGLAALLLRVQDVPGLKLLVAFLCGVGVWGLACELPSWLGPGADRAATSLVAFSALTSAVYLHFVLVLCGTKISTPRLRAIYLVGGTATVAALLIPSGRYQPWHGFDSFFIPNAMGWIVGAVWGGLAAAAHLVLFWYWLRRKGPPRGQLVAMSMASGWGALCMSGYAFAPLGIDVYPFPLLFLPLYPLILVYGILRYRLMIVNAWARRALGWALVVGLGSAAVIGLAALPLPFGASVSGWRLWAVAVATLLASGLLLDPFRRLATRLVYPGSHLAESDVDRWRAALGRAENFVDLAAIASQEISQQLRLQIDVVVDSTSLQRAFDDATPTLVCTRRDERWLTIFTGWDAAPPGPRYVAQLFGTALTEAAQRLEHAMTLALREREQQKHERLAELGALAATVAHDIRNPLNIIAMAAATAAPEVRREIATQTQRISQLATDLLDYAKSWQIEKQPVNLADYLQAATAQYAEIKIASDLDTALRIDADPRRLGQALFNLFDNARAAIKNNGANGRIHIEARHAASGAVELSICDNGPGVPSEIRDTLFQPFVSRRPDGTGLGLAIVAKIMQAHGGSVHLGQQSGSTCFILTFPPRAIP
jgi:signal transduction histidine kinase